MASTSQTSFVARLSRAEQLYQFVNSFASYIPVTPNLSTQALRNLITEISAMQALHVTTHHDYAEAAKVREAFFKTGANSVIKTLTLIRAYLKSKVGEKSQQFIDVNTLISKIRTGKTFTVTINNVEKTISHSEKSYGSQLQNLIGIKTLLTQYGSVYEPINDKIKLPNLNLKIEEAIAINNEVTLKYAAFKPTIEQRQLIFKDLLNTAISIKEAVKSQFGFESSEYNLIKSLKFN